MLVERDPRSTGNVGSSEVTELERRAADMVKTGRVVEADYAKGLVRVGIGDPEDDEGYVKTGWLPMSHGRSNEWNPLKVGEAVVIVSEGGDLPNGVVVPASIHNEDNPAPGDRGDLWRKKFADGSVVEYDEGAGAMKLTGKTNFEASVGDASVKMKDGEGLFTVGGASIKITDGQIVLSAGGQTFTVGGGGATSSGRIKGDDGLEITGQPFTHNGKNVGDDHNHKDVQPGSGISGDPV